MTLHHIKEKSIPKRLEPLEAVRQKVCRAIVTMHAEHRYYDALDILCSIAGWPSFRSELYSPREKDAWAKKAASIVGKKTDDPFVKTLEFGASKTRKCPNCKRRHDPIKEYQRKSSTGSRSCAGCGRRINKTR